MITFSTFRVLVLVLCAVLPAVPAAHGQSDLEKVLKEFDTPTVKGYIQPMADLFGANMNAGYYHSAAISTAGLYFAIDVIGMGSLVSDEHKTYTASTPEGFRPASFTTATIFGGKGSIVSDPADPALTYSGSDGIIDASLFPLVVPQLTIGNVYGTQAVIRFVSTPAFDRDAFPSTTLFGFGLRHSVSQYLLSAPLDLSAGFLYSSFTVGDIIDFKGLTVGVQASKSFSAVTLYGGLGWEKSTMNLTFRSNSPNGGNIDLDLDGENQFRITAGGALTIAVLNIFADVNLGSVTNLSAGIGIAF